MKDFSTLEMFNINKEILQAVKITLN